jgi:hypothetical protein
MWRAGPRLSAKTVAQNPGGSVMPTRPVAQATLAPPAGVVAAPTPMLVDVVEDDDVLAHARVVEMTPNAADRRNSLMARALGSGPELSLLDNRTPVDGWILRRASGSEDGLSGTA